LATQDTIKFGDVSLLFGDGDGTEAFEAVCGFTSVNWQTGTTENSEDLPDCDDPDAPSYTAPTITAVSDTVQVQGFVDVDNSELVFDWIQSGESKNIRIAYNKTGKKGYYAGPAVATNREEAYERRQSGKLSATIKFQAKPVWTAVP
jgi:hypothetical protein